MVKNPYYQQNNGRLPSDPPNYLGTVAREVWRKIVPFLENTNKIQRIDTFLVETYCTNYEIYKLAYEDIKENGIQQEIRKPIQSPGSGEILGEQSMGFKKNPAVATMKDAVVQSSKMKTIILPTLSRYSSQNVVVCFHNNLVTMQAQFSFICQALERFVLDYLLHH